MSDMTLSLIEMAVKACATIENDNANKVLLSAISTISKETDLSKEEIKELKQKLIPRRVLKNSAKRKNEAAMKKLLSLADIIEINIDENTPVNNIRRKLYSKKYLLKKDLEKTKLK